MESIDLKIDDLEPVQINFSDPTPTSSSSNFGSGIELLMNEKTKNSNYSTTIDMKDLDDIETELNDLTTNLDGVRPLTPPSSGGTKSIGGFGSTFSSFFGGGSKSNSETENIKIITEDDQNDSRIGLDTVETISGNTKTWDGYSRVSDVPSRVGVSFPVTTMSERERRRKKRTMLRNLDDWYEKGLIKTASRYTMDSSYEEIEDEYEGALEDKRKKDAVKIQQNWMVTMINTIEYGNAFFDPFGINLDGWGEAVSEDIDSYDEIFEQLYEKYKGGKMSPELSLLLKLAFTATTIHYSNTMMSKAIPGMGDIMRQNPDLMKMFANATADSMKKSSPGMAFASELLNNNKPSPMTGPPPVPVETRNQPPPQRPGMQFTMSGMGPMSQEMPPNRPDISMGRGAMFRESGVDINSGYKNFNESQEKSVRPPPQQPPMPSHANQPAFQTAPLPPQPPTQRPEMTGPKISDIDSILSGLKTKTVNIRESITPQTSERENIEYTENDSVISIASLKDMQNATMPKKSNRRKQKSDKNVVSLDI